MAETTVSSRVGSLEERTSKHEEVINNQGIAIQKNQATLDQIRLQMSQQAQVLEQYRVSIYNLELRLGLFIKILEEKGILVKGEYEKRWPIYLKNDVGVTGADGVMEGSLKVTFYGEEGGQK